MAAESSLTIFTRSCLAFLQPSTEPMRYHQLGPCPLCRRLCVIWEVAKLMMSVICLTILMQRMSVWMGGRWATMWPWVMTNIIVDTSLQEVINNGTWLQLQECTVEPNLAPCFLDWVPTLPKYIFSPWNMNTSLIRTIILVCIREVPLCCHDYM